MILLDTDTYTLHQLGHESVLERFAAASEVASITIITQIEVLRGRQEALFKAEDAPRILRAQQLLVATIQHMGEFQVVLLDDTAAAEFDRLRQIKGLKKIGRGDLLIASIALANRALLVTRNLKDFRKVPSLQIENWVD